MTLPEPRIAWPWPEPDADGSHSPLAEPIREEMAARGWTVDDVVERMGGDDPPFDAICLELLLATHDDRMILDRDLAAKLGRAFDVSPELFLNLDAATRSPRSGEGTP